MHLIRQFLNRHNASPDSDQVQCSEGAFRAKVVVVSPVQLIEKPDAHDGFSLGDRMVRQFLRERFHPRKNRLGAHTARVNLSQRHPGQTLQRGRRQLGISHRLLRTQSRGRSRDPRSHQPRDKCLGMLNLCAVPNLNRAVQTHNQSS
ncbi:hypothetical protein R4I43_19600 [Saccharopolyspora sp. S2-29]|uniref:Uncharacterized protein n=1 Tax=Saccharopolyspora mangrovi TaxID=3082379 RepID=A0ABU6ADR8_9PSEU|nr:hypothetical protein [Saccharopolyspora sp. S2-29]